MTDQTGFWCCLLAQKGMPCSCFPVPSEPPIARTTDPETSHEAAQALRGTMRLGAVHKFIIDHVIEMYGPSEKELFDLSPLTDRTCFSPSFARLRAAGYIENRPPNHPERTTRDPYTKRRQLRWFPGWRIVVKRRIIRGDQ